MKCNECKVFYDFNHDLLEVEANAYECQNCGQLTYTLSNQEAAEMQKDLKHLCNVVGKQELIKDLTIAEIKLFASVEAEQEEYRADKNNWPSFAAFIKSNLEYEIQTF